MRKATSTILAAICAFAAVGCGGSGSTVLGIDSNPRIRTVSTITSPNKVSIFIDDNEIKRYAEPNFVSDYTIYTNGNHTFHFNDSTTSASLIDSSQLLELNGYYTAIGFNDGDGYRLMLLSDKPSTGGVGAHIKVVNAAQTNYDVYVTSPGADISGSDATRSNLAVGKSDEPYTDLDLSGSATKNFQVRITLPGTKVPVATANVTLASRQSTTFVITSNGTTPSLLALPTKSY